MIEARFVPIDQWPGARTKPTLRKRNPFRAPYLDTLDLLEYELGLLRAKEIVFQSGFTWAQLRNDGWPRAGETPSDPGIIISFRCGRTDESLSFPCDAYAHFQANMRAIGLSLEALRAVDRHGVTRQAEQYRGWAQIEAPRPQSFASTEEAASFIASQATQEPAADVRELAREILDDPSTRKAAYRQAATFLHPDKGGSIEMFVRLQEALSRLEA